MNNRKFVTDTLHYAPQDSMQDRASFEIVLKIDILR